MNRLWQGLILLLILLTAGLFVTASMGKIYQAMSGELESAAQAAQAEDWPAAAGHFYRAEQIRDQSFRFSAAFTDHGPMEEMNGLFSASEVLLAHHASDFAVIGVQLSQLVRAIGESHSLSWWNLL